MKFNIKNFGFRNISSILIILLISIIITFIFGGFSSVWQALALNIAYGLMIGLTISLGCGYISESMLKNKNWIQKPVKKYVSVILAVTAFIIIDVIVINMFWFKLSQGRELLDIFRYGFYIRMMLFELIIAMVIYLIILSYHFAKNMNEYYLESQKAKEERNKFRYATLKNQINPHFLFNSLNVLSGMIYKDVEKSDDFISKLAGIYRYVLDVQDEEVVSLEKEIGFIKEYLFLLSSRFNNNLKYEINAKSDQYIIPMAVQILVENALKHNKVSDEKPLYISISTNKDYLLVTNSLNRKEESTSSLEIGLNNINSRYKYVTDKKITISESEHKFSVSIPLLKIKK
jgi:sensor histidine kinase YesM